MTPISQLKKKNLLCSLCILKVWSHLYQICTRPSFSPDTDVKYCFWSCVVFAYASAYVWSLRWVCPNILHDISVFAIYWTCLRYTSSDLKKNFKWWLSDSLFDGPQGRTVCVSAFRLLCLQRHPLDRYCPSGITLHRMDIRWASKTHTNKKSQMTMFHLFENIIW